MPRNKLRAARVHFLACAALIVAAATITFSPVWRHQFLRLDDRNHTIDNRWLNPPTPSGLWRFWREPYFGLYNPLAYMFFAAETWVARLPTSSGARWDLDPRVFHGGNHLLHVLVALVVFAILTRLVGSQAAACCGALLFALHPVQTEAVAWISETRGVLAALLALLAIARFLSFRALETATPLGGSVGRRRLDYWLAATLFWLAILAKPSAVAAPLVAVVIDWGWYGRRPVSAARALWPWWLLAVAAIIVSKSQQTGDTIAYATPLWARPLVAADALAFYLYKLVVPAWLGIDYGRTPQTVLAEGWLYFTWLVPALAVIAASWLDFTRRASGFIPEVRNSIAPSHAILTSLGIFVAGILPVSGLVDFSFQSISTVADRYVYLSMLGPALALAWWTSRRSRVVVDVVIVACLTLGIPTYFQAERWHDDESLFRHAIVVNPRSLLALNNLGLEYVDQKRFDDAEVLFHRAMEVDPQAPLAYYHLGNLRLRERRQDEAREWYNKAIRVDADFAKAHMALADLFMQQGQYDQSRQFFREALRVSPRDARALYNLGCLELRTGRLDAAANCFHEVIRLEPDFAPAHNNLGNALNRQGNTSEAMQHFAQAVRLAPSDPEAQNNLALLLARQRRYGEAIQHHRRALALRPNWLPAMMGLAWVLVTADDARWRDGREGLELARQTALIAGQENLTSLDVLAAAYAETGQFDDALHIARRGLAKARSARAPKLVELFESRIKQYEHHRPLRGEPILAP